MKLLAQRYGLDVAVVAAGAVAVVETGGVAVALLVLPLLARRRAPFLAPLSLWLLAAAESFADGRAVSSSSAIFAVGLVAAFLLGALPDEARGRTGLAVLVGCALIIAINDPTRSGAELALLPATFALAWLGGYAQQRRVRLAERERETATRLAVAEERARIARELHDIVAHAMSVMVLQVGAVRHRLPDEHAEDAEALRSVEATGRSALGEMRRLLGAMRSGEDRPELTPQPGLERLDDLLDEVRRAGLPVSLDVAGEPFRLPPAIDLSAYRIVQEGLTNALKHARASEARVQLRYAPQELRILVADDGDGTGAGNGGGHGLVGVRERVKLYGGRMSAAGDADGFRLETSLPVTGGEP